MIGTTTNKINLPQITLPKGGGTVRGADENFHADAFTGASGFNVSIPLPQARGLMPSLGVGYSSTSGNGLLGMGFHLTEDSISIKTNSALPLYNEKDIYLYGSAELVLKNGATDIYLERHQASFERIQKTNNTWKIIHNDNSVSMYGEDKSSTIFDPNHEDHIFKWLVSSQIDSHGNKVKYHYDKFGGVNTYLTSVEYGNYILQGEECFAYKVIIDYGQVDYDCANTFLFKGFKNNPSPRPDPLTTCRAGFAIKTEYRIHNIFIQHNFKDDSATGADCFTHRTEFIYQDECFIQTCNSIVKHIKQHSLKKTTLNEYAYKALPTIDLDFSTFAEQGMISFTPVKDDKGAIINQPLSLVDYHREGIAGILYRNAESLYYYPALGNGVFEKNTTAITAPNQFSDPRKPLHLVSLEGNGVLQIEYKNQQLSGYYPSDEATDDTSWLPFVPFSNEFLNNIPYRTEQVDLSGRNRSDQLIITPQKIYYRASLGLEGYSADVVEIDNSNDVEAENSDHLNPYIYYGFADVYGDGMAHRIKVENKKMTIWPNLGYGNFGAKQQLTIPDFKIEEGQINLKTRLIVADVNGSGVADLVLIYKDKIQVFFNHNGTAFSEPLDYSFEGLTWSDYDYIQFVDITGRGNTCLVFSKLSPHTFKSQKYDIAHYYYEFNSKSGDQYCNKAFLLKSISNGMGVTTELYYKSSLQDYLSAKGTEDQWLTKLPFPTLVLESNTVTDFISNTVFKSQYTYRNGYYDTQEHSFVGFGYVAHTDIPSIKKQADEIVPDTSLPALLTKQWFHLGAGTDEIKTKQQFFKGDAVASNIPFQYQRTRKTQSAEALFAMAGTELHHEVYDQEDLSCPYTLASTGYEIIEVQAPDETKNKRGVYRLIPKESIDFNYEKQKDDPQVSHSFILETDVYNQPLKACAVVYPRRVPLIPEQGALYCSASSSIIKNQDDEALPRMIGVGLESKSFEVTGLNKPQATYYSFEELQAQLMERDELVEQINYSDALDTSKVQCRLLSWQKEFYWKDEKQNSVLDCSTDIVPAVLLPHHSEEIVFDNTNVEDILGEKKNGLDFSKNGYEYKEGYWWARSVVNHFADKIQFFLPKQLSYDWAEKTNYLYTETQIDYDVYSMFPLSSSARLNDDIQITTASEMDYRLLSPWRVTDANGNKAEVLTDILGMIVATASYGKDGISGDMPLASYKRKEVVDLNEVLVANPLDYIQHAASFFHYEFPLVDSGWQWAPGITLSLTRTAYKTQDKNDIQRSISYSDGFGRVIESKGYAGKQTIHNTSVEDAWLASGRVEYNAKGEIALSYLSYFSDTFRHQNDWDAKIKATLPPPAAFVYDTAGRLIRTYTPQGLFSSILIPNAWETLHFDESDTILESDYYQRYKSGITILSNEEKDALLKSVSFYNTPSIEVIDGQGRPIITVSDNRMNQEGEKAKRIAWKKHKLTFADINAQDENLLVQWQSFDIQGRVLLQADARFNEYNQNAAAADKKYNFKHLYPIAGGMAYTWSADAGTSWMYADAAGNNLFSWDALGNKHGVSYDHLHRVLTQTVQAVLDTRPKTVAKTVYGETQFNAQRRNLVGKVFQRYDNAGFSIVETYTFDGHPFFAQFQFRTEYKKEADWDHGNETLEAEAFTNPIMFDAAGRVLRHTLPDGSMCNWKYGVMGNCISSAITVNRTTTEQKIVSDSQLNQFGQLTSVSFGNGVYSKQVYDPLTMQLQQIKTLKGIVELQNQVYWHDATGLITTMHNRVAETVFHKNQQVNPATLYSYDALYRLLTATGRMQRTKGNLQDIENYTEKYNFDKGNNLLSLQRVCSNAFTRNYSIDTKSNRVSSYQLGKDNFNIAYDVLGQMQNINGTGSQTLLWNTQGNIVSATIVERSETEDMNVKDTEYYVYSAGIRVRKVTERLNNGQVTIEDKRYLGAYKRTIKPNANTRHSITIGGIGKHDCEIHYSTDAAYKITKDGIMYRFQHANHLNSIGLETNQQGEIISYEEYSPYGETVYNFSLNNLDSSKEYRYSAQERDNSTGLYYYGYRYYAPWLCRWTRPDPAGTIDGFNLYAFVGNEPIGKVDVMGLVRKKGTSRQSKGEVARKRKVPDTKKGTGKNIRKKSTKSNAKPVTSTKVSKPKKRTSFNANKERASKYEYELETSRVPQPGKDNLAAPHRFSYKGIADGIRGLPPNEVEQKIVIPLLKASENYRTLALSDRTSDNLSQANLRKRTRDAYEEGEDNVIEVLNKSKKSKKNPNPQPLDTEKLIQALNNLASNAPSYGPHKKLNTNVGNALHLNVNPTTGQLTPRSEGALTVAENVGTALLGKSGRVALTNGGDIPAPGGIVVPFSNLDPTLQTKINNLGTHKVKSISGNHPNGRAPWLG